jgi:surfactin synthase thioesterase subunit
MNKIKLICLPFAGGSKYAYHRYVRLAPDWLEIIPIDLPGRGSRMNETLLTDMDAIVDDVMSHIRDITVYPYAIYGHSMGALIALLVTRRIRKEKLNEPLHLFVTGHGGPSVNDDRVIRHKLPEPQLIDELLSLNGMPQEILDDKVLMDFFLPVIRADFQAIETFEYQAESKLDLPITCIIGREEKITVEKAQAWENETYGNVDVRRFPGKHFFIFEHDKEVIRLISKMLDQSLTYRN